MEEEIWKIIEEYPIYDVSNFGNIRNNKTNYVMKLQKNYSGYMKISLKKEDKSYNCIVHRLVAKTFIPNPYNKPTVNHIDRDKTNNNVFNLEWATMSEQNYHLALTNKKEKPINYKPVCKIDITTNEIIDTYKSVTEASIWIIDNKLTKITEKTKNKVSIISSKICGVANNKRNIAYGYKWKYIITDTLENEIWKEIPLELVNKSNYYISNFGRYKNNKGDIKVDYKYISGYKRLSINKKMFLLHRLVALTFLENPEIKKW